MDLTVVADGLGFVEAPRWHRDRLYFSDFYARRVMTVDGAGTLDEVAYVAGQPSGLGFAPDGALMIVASHEGHILRCHEGSTSILADIGAIYRGALNDMIVDGAGRCYVSAFPVPAIGPGTTMSPPTPDTVSIPLFRVDPDGTVDVVAEDLKIPNGMAISADGRQLVVAETYGNRLTAFDIAENGSLTGRRVFADLEHRRPDGICLDSEGAAWVGSFATNEYVRVREGGEVLTTISTPSRWAVSCTLGGPDLCDLYCTTVELQIADYANGRGRGRIERARVEVPGV